MGKGGGDSINVLVVYYRMKRKVKALPPVLVNYMLAVSFGAVRWQDARWIYRRSFKTKWLNVFLRTLFFFFFLFETGYYGNLSPGVSDLIKRF